MTEKDAFDRCSTLIIINTEHRANPVFHIETGNLKLETTIFNPVTVFCRWQPARARFGPRSINYKAESHFAGANKSWPDN